MSNTKLETGKTDLFFSSLKSLKAAIRAKEKELLLPLGKRIVERYKNITRKDAKYPYIPYTSIPVHNDLFDFKELLKDYEQRDREHTIEDFYDSVRVLYQAFKISADNNLFAYHTTYQSYKKLEEELRTMLTRFQGQDHEVRTTDEDVEAHILKMVTTLSNMNDFVMEAVSYYDSLMIAHLVTEVLLKGFDVLGNHTSDQEQVNIQEDVEASKKEVMDLWDKCEKEIIPISFQKIEV